MCSAHSSACLSDCSLRLVYSQVPGAYRKQCENFDEFGVAGRFPGHINRSWTFIMRQLHLAEPSFRLAMLTYQSKSMIGVGHDCRGGCDKKQWSVGIRCKAAQRQKTAEFSIVAQGRNSQMCVKPKACLSQTSCHVDQNGRLHNAKGQKLRFCHM